jgi:hypothetical protein
MFWSSPNQARQRNRGLGASHKLVKILGPSLTIRVRAVLLNWLECASDLRILACFGAFRHGAATGSQ